MRTLPVALQHYGVSYSTMSYYKRQLLESGYAECASAVAAAARASEAPSTSRKPRKNRVELAAAKVQHWDIYCKAYIEAGQETLKIGKRKAAQRVSEKYDISFSASSALRASHTPGQPPQKPGRRLILGSELESKLESFCLVLRAMRLPILRCMVINYVNVLVEGTEAQEMLKHGEVRNYWYYNFLTRAHRLQTANIKPLEVKRAQWATSENALKHYTQLAEMLVETGIDVPNPNFDPKDPTSEQVKIVKPSRLASMDETRLSNDTTENNKSKVCRSIVGKENDDRNTLVNNLGRRGWHCHRRLDSRRHGSAGIRDLLEGHYPRRGHRGAQAASLPQDGPPEPGQAAALSLLVQQKGRCDRGSGAALY